MMRQTWTNQSCFCYEVQLQKAIRIRSRQNAYIYILNRGAILHFFLKHCNCNCLVAKCKKYDCSWVFLQELLTALLLPA